MDALRISLLALVLFACSKSGSNNSGGGSGPAPTVNAEVIIQAADTKQTIQGFGCATVFNPPNTTAYTSTEFDRLYGTSAGQVGLSILRIRVASDNTWRQTELNHAKWAYDRGARILASPWSPPASMKTNGNIIGGFLNPDSAANYGRYLNDFAVYMAANGAPLYAISVQNEPDWNPSYEGCQWSADQMRDFLKNQGHLISATRLMAPELVNNNQSYINTILNDPGAVANLDLLGTHIYGGGIVENATAKALNKEVWMTEHLDTNIYYAANIKTAVEIHNCLTQANFNAYIWWYGKRFYGPIGQDGLVTTRGYVISHFSRFIRPGAVRIGTGANTRSEVLVSAYINSGKKVIVAINTGLNNVNQQFTLQGGGIGNIMPITTTGSQNVVQGTLIVPVSNVFNFVLPPNSITSFVEQ
jgi:glucuronoarabinoxylan endo-1,4-beta-xylanase